jgi:hypothetical protein
VNEYYHVIHWPSQKKVFQGDWETATGFMDNQCRKVAPGPALIETDYALVAARDTSKKGGRRRGG